MLFLETQFIVGAVLGFIALSLEMRFIYVSCGKLKELMLFNKLIWIISLIIYFVCILSCTGVIIYELLYMKNTQFFTILLLSRNVTVIIIIYIMLLNMYGRLKYVFIGTIHQPSLKTLKYYFISIQVMFFFWDIIVTSSKYVIYTYICTYIYTRYRHAKSESCMHIYIVIDLVYEYKVGKNKVYGIGFVISWFLLCFYYLLYLVITPFMLKLFINKLFQMHNNLMLNMGKIGGMDRYDVLIKLIVKYVILYSFQYITTLARLVVQLRNGTMDPSELELIIGLITFYLDLMANMGALYLQHKFSEKDYHGCCLICNKWGLKCIQSRFVAPILPVFNDSNTAITQNNPKP